MMTQDAYAAEIVRILREHALATDDEFVAIKAFLVA